MFCLSVGLTIIAEEPVVLASIGGRFVAWFCRFPFRDTRLLLDFSTKPAMFFQCCRTTTHGLFLFLFCFHAAAKLPRWDCHHRQGEEDRHHVWPPHCKGRGGKTPTVSLCLCCQMSAAVALLQYDLNASPVLCPFSTLLLFVSSHGERNSLRSSWLLYLVFWNFHFSRCCWHCDLVCHE